MSSTGIAPALRGGATLSMWAPCAAAALLPLACGDGHAAAAPPPPPTMMMAGPVTTAGSVAPGPGAAGMPGAVTPGIPVDPGTAGAAGSVAMAAGVGGAMVAAGSGAMMTAGSDATMTAGSGSMMMTAGSGEAGSGTAGTEAPPVTMNEAMGCGTTTLLPNPDDTTKRGPWPVGQKTVKFGRFEAVEVMYPAMPGSDAGKTELKYDLRDWLPASQRTRVPDREASMVGAGTFRDLPIDAAHGPYPVVILVHGTGAFRVASWPTQAHWASRGFVVVAADHPNLYLTDTMEGGCGVLGQPALDLKGDVESEIALLTSAAAPLDFLKGRIDMTRLALAGHSAGAYNIAQFSTMAGVQVIIPLAGTRRVTASTTLKSIVFVSGASDTVLPYASGGGSGSLLYPGTTLSAYMASPGPPGVKKRVLAITGGGHLAVTDLCQDNVDGNNPLEVAQNNGVCGLGILPTLFDCGTVDRVKGLNVVNDVTAGVLEETLHCHDRAAVISAIKTRHTGLVQDFQELK